MEKLTFIDFFSGIGGFRLGLENAGLKCIGHCEIDKYANASYINMHKPDKKEWYESDIKRVTAKSIPKSDIWTAGFPCQDISQAGKRRGLAGKRSGLFYAITRLIEKVQEENKPRWLIFENVRGLFSVNRGIDFYRILLEMDRCGYDAEWQIINSATYVPQSRNRVFIIGRLRGRGSGKIFPIRTTNAKTLKQLIRGGQGNRVYAPSGTSTTLTSAGGGGGAKTGLYAFIDKSVFPKLTNHLRALSTKERGISNRQGESPAVFMALPFITPNRETKRQNGRRIKNSNEPMFTLTSQDRHGILELPYKINSANKKGYERAYIGDGIDLERPESQTRRGRVGIGIAPTLTTSSNIGTINQHNFKIRRLTPRECFRLQGFPDKYFDLASEGVLKLTDKPDTQLYKMAGNSVTVPVIEAIGNKIMKIVKEI